MKLTKTLLVVIFSLLFVIGCSEINNDITPPTDFTHHAKGFGDVSSPNFHKLVFENSNWSVKLTDCQPCHAADYKGGTVGVSCLTCHTQANGPEACNTCHGNFSDPNFIAPSNGAHYKHVYNNSISKNIGCFDCHTQTVSSSNFVYSHISAPPADIELGSIAFSDSLGLDPNYDFTNQNCSNTYCHGGFKFAKSASANQWGYSENYIVGNNYSPIWNSTTGTEASCGTCHGEIDGDGNLITPQPKGHFGSFTLSDCANCHGTVVNSSGEIIDKDKHINKAIDR